MQPHSSAVCSNQLPIHTRYGTLGLLRLIWVLFSYTVLARAAPVQIQSPPNDGPSTPDDPQTWIYLGTAIALVLLGGAFAGLTIALMGQDEVYLQVIAESGEGSEKKNAIKVLGLLQRGKHWVLVTLLVGNVITNETLPIVLDRSIGGGYAAAISSTILVIIFGEIVPQSICVRFGLPIGAWMANFVLTIMWITCPITWPIAKLLDRLLGQDHGTTYKKAGLKSLVTLHQTIGHSGAERLNEDEVSIISGVLDLKAKSVGSIMTPMNDVFVLSADAVLDEEMMDDIMREGYSRIPIHEPKNKSNFVGMLLVKMLITYDPEDARKVSDFALATLPETLPSTSCLDIINFFQEGKSHMVLVSDYPGESYGALGVVTLEDVIEELIGEEIIDESDVFVDVHKAIRRMAPAPTHRPKLHSKFTAIDVHRKQDGQIDSRDGKDETFDDDHQVKRLSVSSDRPRSPLTRTLSVRRRSSGGSPASEPRPQVTSRQYSTGEVRQHLRNLGPSNAARQPKSTRIGAVKIKPGVGTIPENATTHQQHDTPQNPRNQSIRTPSPNAAQAGNGATLVSPGKDASDGVQAVQAGYGSMDRNGTLDRPRSSDHAGSATSDIATEQTSLLSRPPDTNSSAADKVSETRSEPQRTASHDTIHSLQSTTPTNAPRQKEVVRSGSITENFVTSGGVKKLVLEMSSSSEDGNENGETSEGRKDSVENGTRSTRRASSVSSRNVDMSQATSQNAIKPGQIIDGNKGVQDISQQGEATPSSKSAKKKKKKKKKGQSQGGNRAQDENTPLLERDEEQ